MKSSLEARILNAGLVAALSCALAQENKIVQKPGVPGLHAPMSYQIPDAQYKIEANGVKGGPDWLAITEDSVWTNSMRTDMTFRMDVNTDKVLAAVPVSRPCSGFAVAAGTLWSPSCGEKVIYRIDLKTNQVVAKVPVGPANMKEASPSAPGRPGCPAIRRASSHASIQQQTR